MQLGYTSNGNLWSRISSNATTWGGWGRIIQENTSGNVGIGTISPAAKLDVNG